MKKITFASRLQELVKAAGSNSNQLAIASGIKRQAVNRFMLGQREPTFGNLVRVARALKISLAEFDCVTIISPVPKQPKRKKE